MPEARWHLTTRYRDRIGVASPRPRMHGFSGLRECFRDQMRMVKRTRLVRGILARKNTHVPMLTQWQGRQLCSNPKFCRPHNAIPTAKSLPLPLQLINHAW